MSTSVRTNIHTHELKHTRIPFLCSLILDAGIGGGGLGEGAETPTLAKGTAM